MPIMPLIILCFVTILIDCYFGIKVAIKQKQKVESKLSWNGSIKKIKETFLVLTLARAIEFYIFKQTGMYILTGGAALLISLTELWSILENMNTLNPYGPWKAISTFLRKKGNDYLGVDISALQQGSIQFTNYTGINNLKNVIPTDNAESTASTQKTSDADNLSGSASLSNATVQAK